MISYRYSEEKFCLGNSWELRVNIPSFLYVLSSLACQLSFTVLKISVSIVIPNKGMITG